MEHAASVDYWTSMNANFKISATVTIFTLKYLTALNNI